MLIAGATLSWAGETDRSGSGLIEDVLKSMEQPCAAAFGLATEAILGSQPAYPPGSDALLKASRDALIREGLFGAREFDGLTLRWCALGKSINGLAPDRDVVCVSDVWLRRADRLEAAISLAHEMIHVRQFRRLDGTGATFKCEYAKEFIRCGGRQEGCISFETEAYDFEDRVACPRLAAIYLKPGRRRRSFDAAAFCRKRASERPP